MVADCGKPDWVVMRYRITNIFNKRPDKPNRYHERIVGKRCGIEYLGPGSYCWLWIEGMRGCESYTRYHTSTVMDTKPFDGGTLMETANSVYTLKWIGDSEDENL